MKKEVQAARSGTDPRRKKEANQNEAGTAGGFQSLSRDRRSVFDRIAKGKTPIPDSELTPLNTSRSRVLSVMEQNNLGRASPKMYGNRKKRNSNIYCLYHRDIGHETEDYNDFKREIEHLIKQGHLKQFICQDRVINGVTLVPITGVTNAEMIDGGRGIVVDPLRILRRREGLPETSPRVMG